MFFSNYDKVLLGNVAEHPDFFDKNTMQLDYIYYVKNQIRKPLTEFLSKILDNNQQTIL